MTAIPATSYTSRVLVDGTLAITVHVDPPHRLAAQTLFSAPGTPLALAGLKAPDPEPELKGGELAKLAGQWCRDPRFLEWVRPIYDRTMGGDGKGWGDVTPESFSLAPGKGQHDYCRHAMLVLCNIDSRRELDNDSGAAQRFHTLIRLPYSEWLKSKGTT